LNTLEYSYWLMKSAVAQNTDPFTIPMPAIAAGFQAAFLFVAGLSLAAVFFAWYARDATDPS
jgi:hypothetical protein